MSRQIIASNDAPQAVGPYSQAVRIGNMLYTSGQIPLDPHSGVLVDGDIATQTRRVFDNLKAVCDAAGASFVHSAYALGMGGSGSETGVRRTLLDVTTALGDLETLVGEATLEPDAAFVATAYRLQARAVDPTELSGQDPAPTIVDWPAGVAVVLADATECVRIDAAAVGSLFIDAKQNTYFKQGDVVYQLAVAGVLPGDPVC